MASNESVEFFLRLIKEKHDLTKSQLNGLLQALSSDNHDEKVKASHRLLTACEDLSESLSNADRPTWLNQLISATRQYEQHHNVTGQNFKLLNSVIDNKNQALSHSWPFNKPNSNFELHFDRIYNQHRNDSRLHELFDGLIDSIEKMIRSGEIDSVKALKDLEQLIQVIRQNMNGSYFSIMASREFIHEFIKNLFWDQIGETPVIKQLKSAFEKTVAELDIEIDALHTTVTDEIREKFSTSLKETLIYSANSARSGIIV